MFGSLHGRQKDAQFGAEGDGADTRGGPGLMVTWTPPNPA